MPKYSTLRVAEIVDDEGLDYAITCLINADDIEDEKLRLMWAEADVLLQKINAIVDTALEERDDNGEEDD